MLASEKQYFFSYYYFALSFNSQVDVTWEIIFATLISTVHLAMRIFY
jgi:hypothetical protein